LKILQLAANTTIRYFWQQAGIACLAVPEPMRCSRKFSELFLHYSFLNMKAILWCRSLKAPPFNLPQLPHVLYSMLANIFAFYKLQFWCVCNPHTTYDLSDIFLLIHSEPLLWLYILSFSGIPLKNCFPNIDSQSQIPACSSASSVGLSL